uniref:non-specific protein-tyrosine kinase n=1 Tax=Oryzias sinensis TaxID=183150 RepID=A0A8C7WN60_9TELE
MFPRVILKGTMIKKSQQKKRTSPCNYKERFFVLDTQELKYSERRSGKKPMLKGCIQLSRIKCVEIVCSDIPIPCQYKYPFQVLHDNYYLYIFAPDNDCRMRWVKALKEETKYNSLVAKYHTNFWMDGKWRCCLQTDKLAAGCRVYDPVGCGLYSFMSLQPSAQGMVIALQDYVPMGDDDLPLQKDQEYLLINSSHSEWWAVQDDKGSKGEKNPRVKHYQIRQEDGGQFYLAEKYLFNTIPELIHYHQHNAAGLITRLRYPVLPDGYQWDILPEELILGEEIGSGQFGLVLEGRWRETKVAVKMVREECMTDDEFKEEAKVMMKLSHCKLVQLFGVCAQRSPMCLVFEFMEKGCLTDYLLEKRGNLSQETLLGMCLDVSEGMAYLESSNFIHRDLAARNCLISKNNEVKVSDFGMTRYVLDDQYTSSLCSKFPVKWSAPEVIKYSKFSSKSDVWSFGVLMWEVYNEGRLPYENRSNSEVVESLNAGLRLLKPRLASDAVYMLMDWCWKEKPDDRPSFALLLHELSELSGM